MGAIRNGVKNCVFADRDGTITEFLNSNECVVKEDVPGVTSVNGVVEDESCNSS